MKRMMKKVMSFVLAFSMIMSMLTVAVSATAGAGDGQIENAGGTVYYNADGTTGSAGNYAVALSKTIAAVSGRENEFDITLKVDTAEQVSGNTIQTAPDAAVSLVVDVSRTMAFKNISGSSVEEKATNSRLNVAKRVMKSFLKDYAASGLDENGNQIAHRWVSLVGFGGQAWNYLYNYGSWVDVATPEGMAVMEFCLFELQSSQIGKKTTGGVLGSGNKYIDWAGTINGETIDWTSSHGNGGTNIEAGLMLANNIWDAGGKGADVAKEYCWTVMLSDGEPTMYVDPANSVTKNADGGNGVNSTAFIYGLNATNSSTIERVDYQDVPAEAKEIREESTFEIIAMGNDSWMNSTQRWDLVNNTTCGAWLASLSTDGTINTPGAAEADLAAAFSELYGTIQRELSYMSTDAWKVTDPMGANIAFLGFHGADGALTDTLGKSESENNTASFADGVIDWNLIASGATNGKYAVTYRVRLMTEAEGFVFDQACNTNGRAYLTYQNLTSKGYSALKTLDFAVPSVKGFAADLAFTKLDEKGKALEGAEFALTHAADCGCGLTLATTGTYAAEGSSHSFTGIPSAHKYTLMETKTPEGYVNEEGNRTITVSMGEIIDAAPAFLTADGLAIQNTKKSNILDGEKTSKLVDRKENRWEIEVKVPVPEEDATHDEVIMMVDGSYSGDKVWPQTRKAIVELGESILNGTGSTQLTLMTFGMSDNIVVEGIESVAQLESQLTELPGGLLYGRSSTNCEAGFTGIAEYIDSKADELDNVYVIYISDGNINTDETPFTFGDFTTYTWLPNKIGNEQFLKQAALEYALYYGKDAQATIDVFGSNAAGKTAFAEYMTASKALADKETTMTEEQMAANSSIVSAFEANVDQWADLVFQYAYAEFDENMVVGQPYPISVVEDAIVSYDKNNGTWIQELFYYTTYGRSYPDRWTRTPAAATALAAHSKVAHMYMIDNNAASGWMNPEYSEDPTVSVQGDNVSFTYNANVTGLSSVLHEILVDLAKTPITEVKVTDYMSKWANLDADTLKIVDNTTGKILWTAKDGWQVAEADRPTAQEVPVVVEKVDPADYEAGGADVVGNTSGDIYKLTWFVKDGNMLRADNFSLVYEVITDVEEEGFEYKVWLPSNGNTDVIYKDSEGEETKRPIDVPDIDGVDVEIKFYDEPYFTAGEDGEPTEDLIDKDEVKKVIEDGAITMDTTIDQIEELKNGYNVTLEVTTKQDLREVKLDTDAAVTLLFDVSGSMLYCDKCGGGHFSNADDWANGIRGEHVEGCPLADQQIDYEISRMKPAIASTKDFLKEYADSSFGGKRMLSIVFFYRHAHLVMDWADLTDEDSLAEALQWIEDSKDWAGSYTCQDAAMRLADLQFDKDDIAGIDNRYAIMVTDGNPTAYATGTLDVDGAGRPAWAGKANYTITVIESSKEAADLLKADPDVEFYTLAYAVDGVAVSKVDDRLVGEWLAQDIATDAKHALNASNGEEISLTFSAITKEMLSGMSLYTVAAPMGEYIDFVTITTDGAKASYDAAKDTVKWNLLEETPVEVIEADGSITYKYTLTYQILLDTEKEGFAWETLYPAAKTISLTYVELGEDGTVAPDAELKTGYFNIPGVYATWNEK